MTTAGNSQTHGTIFEMADSPSFIGPYLVRKVDGYDRLRDFVNIISFNANIKNRFTVEKLIEHTSYVEDFVGSLCKFVGEKVPGLRINEIIRRGSYYDNAKVMSPDEYDFMPILALSYDDAVNVKDPPKECSFAARGYKLININPDNLKEEIPRGSWRKNKDGECQLDLKVLMILLHIVKDFVIQHSKFREELLEDPNAVYDEGVTSMQQFLHGTCIMLRMWAPLCTTDIDLCFCIEQKNQSDERRVLVGDCINGGGCGYCTLKGRSTPGSVDHWTESFFDISPDQHLYILDTMHKKLFVTLKFLSYLLNKRLYDILEGDISIQRELSSYVYKMILLHHQHSCQSTNIGICFETIVELYFNRSTKNDADTVTYSPKGKEEIVKIPDIYFPKRTVVDIESEHLLEFVLLLWIQRHVKHNTNTTWWNDLLDKDFPNNVKQGDLLQTLLDTLKWVIQFQDPRTDAPKVNPRYTWIHDDNVKTVVALSD
ncbi:unnamed protein product [Owenia fusiformis]|uniref:Uncharacterized protein n=1 Tax=Owenia fusiformis TaxID=6347 RepID=A0A8S4QAB5_OWEFU|nr:unnamed protein product [Owenia fusiformis]